MAPGIGCNIAVNHSTVKDDFVVIKCAKDLDKLDPAIINPLPYDKKALAKMSKKIEGLVDVECGEDEFLALVDTGSFTHAIDAARHLPAHQILAVPKSEQHKAGETACGGTLPMLGKVRTTGEVGGIAVAMTWSHMEVKCPILSVRCLIDDGHDVWIRKGGGIIRNLESGKEIVFIEHGGVYYVKMKINKPVGEGSKPLFSRRGA